MVGPRQCHSHGREGRLQSHEGSEEHHQQVEQEGEQVDQPVGQVEGGRTVAQALQDLPHEVPERQRRVVGDVVGLGGRYRAVDTP